MPTNNIENIHPDFITCPKCHGKNIDPKLACVECGGLGVGTFHEGFFLYWNQKYNKKLIRFNQSERRINEFFNALLAIFGLIGFITLAIWIGQRAAAGLDNYAFWNNRDIFILLFWVSVILTMFAWFRYTRSKTIHIIKPLKNGTKDLPNNWGELKTFNPKYKIDAASGFSKKALKVIEEAFMLAEKLGHKEVDVLHLSLCLINDKIIKIFLKRLSVNTDKLIFKINNELALVKKEPRDKNTTITLNESLKKALIETYLTVYKKNELQVYPINFLAGLEAYNDSLAEIFFDLELDENKILNCIEWFYIDKKIISQQKKFKRIAHLKPGSKIDKIFIVVATPILNHFSQDLTRDAKWCKLEYPVGRDMEINNILSFILGEKKTCLLVGDKGVGKKTIIQKIARLIVEDNVPNALKNKRILQINIPLLLEKATPQEIQEKLLVIFDEAEKSGNIILYFENLENLTNLYINTDANLAINEIIFNYFSSRDNYSFASTTSDNFKTHLENKLICNALNVININEPKENLAIQILASKVSSLEKKHQVFFTYNCLAKVIYLTNKYLPTKRLPLKAIEILDLVGLYTAKTKELKSFANEDEVINTMREITNQSQEELAKNEDKIILNGERLISKDIIGQDWAVHRVANKLKQNELDLKEGKLNYKPISFLFVGATGVGKTELAKSIAKIYLGSEKSLVTLDMNEYQSDDSVDRIIGSSSNTNSIVNLVEKSPDLLIELTRIEKANISVKDLIQEILSQGKVNNSQGNPVDFSHCIIIITTCLGSNFIQEQLLIGVHLDEIEEELITTELNQALGVDLISSFNDIIVFNPLTPKDAIQITEGMIKKVEEMLNSKGILLKSRPEGIEILSHAGFDSNIGAKPLRKIIQEMVENKIAKKIIDGLIKTGDTVIIDINGEIMVEKGK